MKTTALSFFVICLTQLSLIASKYDDARELYKEGPTKGPEIIELLEEHLVKNPTDEKAIRLLGITQFGIGRNEEALETFEKAIALAEKDGSISPNLLMCKARALFALDRKYETKRILEVYWAFWQDETDLEELYDWYWERVKNELPSKTAGKAKDRTDPPATPVESKAERESKEKPKSEAEVQSQ